ncbi:hypothetical protein PGAG_00424 [Phaeocystis globosa virus 12T]|uniref:Ankyrin repeat-containing protein n=1 Tax=Phaeocystis globosa virus PgV-16T TaxID=3071227 RepID=A0AC59EWI7_9VIRU|nr:ankyrin repeat-containing protein [Phaeocystis globosa virus]AET72878.1 hypothetical protein PGAG_00424 [Phaeocystis globosa virus 12T]AET73625.1 hypothetical protein PGBG_00409 [Phaeocystis globosa virus 14T]AGM15324.1 ankyrin repeat-containing protein [Phaeocystis globosa virus PgV-16T]UYE94054.1 ankyrin repeat-containing protein [Phaeocystis globosa virus]
MAKTRRNQKKRGGMNADKAASKIQSSVRGKTERRAASTRKLASHFKGLPPDLEHMIKKMIRDDAILKKNTGPMSELLVEAVKENRTDKAAHALGKYGEESEEFLKDERMKGEMKTLLHISAENGNLDITKGLIKLLTDKGKKTNISAGDTIQQTPLHIAASKLTDGHYEIANLLIKNGANIDAIDNYGETPLFLAVKANNIEMVKLLIEKGAETNIENKTQNSIMHYAAEIPGDNVEVLKYLIRNSSDTAVNSINDKEQTPLHLSAELGNTNAAKLLVENGADRDAEDNAGETPAVAAEQADNEDTMNMILDTRLNRLSKMRKAQHKGSRMSRTTRSRSGGKKNKKGGKTRKH